MFRKESAVILWYKREGAQNHAIGPESSRRSDVDVHGVTENCREGEKRYAQEYCFRSKKGEMVIVIGRDGCPATLL